MNLAKADYYYRWGELAKGLIWKPKVHKMRVNEKKRVDVSTYERGNPREGSELKVNVLERMWTVEARQEGKVRRTVKQEETK